MKSLDRSRDYGEIWGATGHSGYLQDGSEFRLDGHPKRAGDAQLVAGSATSLAPEPAPATPATAAERRFAELQAKGYRKLKAAERREYHALKDQMANGTPTPPAPDNPRSDEDLKTLVAIAGGEWTGREAALALLSQTE